MMEKMIVYVDDAAYAQQQLAPLLASDARTAWVLVACAPRMTRHISKWVNHSTRQKWRAKWCDKLFDELSPALRARGDEVIMLLAQGPLPEFTDTLRRTHATARVIDARRPKFGQDMEPVTEGQKVETHPWAVPGAVAGLMVALSVE
jgi:hypothetical protein